ncbi:MAG: protein kinase, partial [Planctomycetota bacterium]|nr:protein kinase [Planctomycetota bacterium]
MAKDHNRLQGRIILAQGWLPKDVIIHALQRVRADTDLCTLLVARGALTRDRADRVRNEVLRKLGAPAQPLIQQVPRGINKRRTTTNTNVNVNLPPPLTKPTQQHAAIRNFVTDSSLFKKALFNQRSPSIVGKRFLRFEIVGELNRGAMGVVYRAIDVDSDRPVAIKFMLADNPSHDEQTRFKREVGVLARLDHPHIVKVVDFGVENGLLFFAMELIEGQNLKDFVDDMLRKTGQPPSWNQIAKILKSIAQALSYCHEMGIVHRDIKPQNIIVEAKTQRAVLLDFGLIKKDRTKVGESFLSGGQSLTQHGELVGTPAFMSPEQFAPGGDFGAIGPCSDVWGFGATLFYALSGTPPYNLPSAIEIFRSIMTYDAPQLAQRNPNAPDWLHALCDACLLRQSMFRPTMADVAQGLEERIAPKVESSSRSDSRSFSRSKVRKKPSKQILGLFATAILLLLIFLGSLPFLFKSDVKSVDFVYVKADQVWTKRPRGRIVGQLTQPEALVNVAGNMTVSDEEGLFSRLVELKEGENTFEIEILEGTKKISRQVTINLDLAPPIIEISGTTEKDVLELKRLVLTGKVVDKMPAQIALGDKTIQLKEDGEFVFPIPQSGKAQTVTLRALDQAGNLQERVLTIFTPKALKNRKGTLFLLSDFEIWMRAKPEPQDQAINEIGNRLGSAYQRLPAKVFQCGKLRIRLGRFRHKASGITLNLIPGGSIQIGSLLSDKEKELVDKLDEKLLEYAAALSGLEQQAERSKVADSYRLFLAKDVATADFRTKLARLRVFAQDRSDMLDILRQLTQTSADSSITDIFGVLREDPKLIDQFNNDFIKMQKNFGGFTKERRIRQKRELERNKSETLRLKQIKRKLNEGPRKWTRVDAVLAGEFEVTRKQWTRFMKNESITDRMNNPIGDVSWNEIQRWLNKAGGELRLPTELEWEYCCRAGSNNNYFW